MYSMSMERTKSGTDTKTQAAALQRRPRRTTQSTKQMHERLLRALKDRRIKRAFS
jgi:hypothetical protein